MSEPSKPGQGERPDPAMPSDIEIKRAADYVRALEPDKLAEAIAFYRKGIEFLIQKYAPEMLTIGNEMAAVSALMRRPAPAQSAAGCAYAEHVTGSAFHSDGGLCPAAKPAVVEQPAGSAEQFLRERYYPTEPPTNEGYSRGFVCEFAEAYAASQLAKLREELAVEQIKVRVAHRALSRCVCDAHTDGGSPTEDAQAPHGSASVETVGQSSQRIVCDGIDCAWERRAEAAEALVGQLREQLDAVTRGAINIETDQCLICGAVEDRHTEDCQILAAEALLVELRASEPAGERNEKES